MLRTCGSLMIDALFCTLAIQTRLSTLSVYTPRKSLIQWRVMVCDSFDISQERALTLA